ncbi:MAG: hypothetical protein JWO99_61 [Candidatus Saccharibacteria bacterium]|nr:hypothetical protein [Candidatus Saccharibacteria bacterium]
MRFYPLFLNDIIAKFTTFCKRLMVARICVQKSPADAGLFINGVD